MAKYLVLVYGRNFRLPFKERRKTIIKVTGFYTTRCIVASGPIQAEYKAMELIRHDSKLRRSVRNPRTDPPIMHAVEVHRVESFAPLKPPGTGYVFFHGRGAGRPRTLELAPFRPNIPKDIKRAVIGRFGNPARRGSRVT
jgi:hypothetical protein